MINVYLEDSRLILVPEECQGFKGNKPIAACMHGDESWFCNEWHADEPAGDLVCTLPELVETLKAVQDSKR